MFVWCACERCAQVLWVCTYVRVRREEKHHVYTTCAAVTYLY